MRNYNSVAFISSTTVTILKGFFFHIFSFLFSYCYKQKGERVKLGNLLTH